MDLLCREVMFCHCREKFTRDLLREFDDPGSREKLIYTVCECPVERTVRWGRTGP